MQDVISQLFIQNETKATIFKVAAQLFAENGYHGVSMREISEKSGVSKPAIYYHFTNKEGIFSALIEAGLNHNRAIFEKILKQDLPVREKIIGLMKLRFRQIIENPDQAKVFMSLFTAPGLPFMKKFIDMAHNMRAMLINLIREAVESGEFGPGTDPDIASEVFVATITHYTWNQLNSDIIILNDALAEQLFDFLFRGLNE